MTPEDIILGLICTSGVIGIAIGMLLGMLGSAWLGDCHVCRERQQAELEVKMRQQLSKKTLNKACEL